MALVRSKYIKYDMDIQEYYITLEALTNLTGYTSDDIALAFGEKVNINLKNISHSVYRLIYNWRRSPKGKYAHKKYMRKKIYENIQEEVIALRNAMIEMAKGAIESGMDLNAYINDPKETYPPTVISELKSANLLDSSHKDENDLDISYTEEDEGIAT